MGCSWAVSSWSCSPALLSEHPWGLQHLLGLPWGWGMVQGTHAARASIHPSIHLFAQKQGVLVCAVLLREEGGGRGWEPPGACCHQATIPAFPAADAGGAQLSPRPLALQCSSSREVFFGTGPLAPRPDAVAQLQHCGRRGQGGLQRSFASLPEPGILVALAPWGTGRFSLDHHPQKPSGESNGLLLFIK